MEFKLDLSTIGMILGGLSPILILCGIIAADEISKPTIKGRKKSNELVICRCIGDIIALATALEAMEHNAIVNKIYKKPAREKHAENWSRGWAKRIQNKCGIITDDIQVAITDYTSQMNNKHWDQAIKAMQYAKDVFQDRVMMNCGTLNQKALDATIDRYRRSGISYSFAKE